MKSKIQTVAVFGGGSGIGEAVVRKFAEHGYRILIGDINMERSRALADEFETVECRRVDIMRKASWGKAISYMQDEWGYLNHYVHCPGGPVPGELEATLHPDLNGFLDMTGEDINNSVQFNLLPFMTISQAMAKLMIASRQDAQSISGIGSINDTGAYGLPAYSASKSAMVAFAKSIANELGPRYGIKVNVVAPGSTETPLTVAEGMNFEAVDRTTMLRRHTMPQDIAAEVFHVATSPAITGQRRVVDSGQVGAADASRYER